MSKAGRRHKKGVSTPPILRTCNQAQRTKQDVERPPTGQARGTKGRLYAFHFAHAQPDWRASKTAEQANGQGRQKAKKGVSTPPISAYAAKTKGEAKPQNKPMVKAGRRRKKGVSTPPVLRTCSQAQRTVSL